MGVNHQVLGLEASSGQGGKGEQTMQARSEHCMKCGYQNMHCLPS